MRCVRGAGAWTWRSLGLVIAMTLAALAVGSESRPAAADDGAMLRKEVTKTPDLESDHAQLSMMQFYVEATRASGDLVSEDDKNPTPSGQIEYWGDDPAIEDVNQGERDYLALTRGYAKPLIVSYWDEAESEDSGYDILTGDEVGVDIRRDAFVALSLDDGETWKEQNLSESALETSFTLENGLEYPGDVTELVHVVAGHKILAAWTSKYCDQGSPRYSAKPDLDGDGKPDQDAEPIFPDPFGVAGSQRSIDYTEWMHQGEYPFAHVGEVPFSCVWTARGTVERVISSAGTPDDPTDDREVWGVRWRKPERLTSGRRDAYKLAIDGVEGAGFALAWQEDPEGLRPGYGEGPGVGWSGATVNHKADIWYTTIGWSDFDWMQTETGEPTLEPALLDTNKPKVFEWMSMPVRLTDNDKCELEDDGSGNLVPKQNEDGQPTAEYCYDLDRGDGTAAGQGTPDGIGDLCPVERNEDGTYTVVDASRIVDWTNAKGKLMHICISDDGRMLNGQTGSSRVRMMLEGYTRTDGTKSAWAALIYEESKGLGEGHEVDPETGEKIPALDLGKDAMYHTFDMFAPDQIAAGHMLNTPETDPASDPENPIFIPLIPNDLAVARAGGDKEAAAANQYQTFIARRGSLALQPGPKIATAAAAGKAAGMTSAILLYKQGGDRQGGPADVFMRRVVIPDGFDPATDNPFAVANLACSAWDTSLTDIVDPTYPRTSYPLGLCLRGAINISGTSPLTFESLGNDDDGETPEHGITQRVLTWEQTAEDLGDEDWENKYDVAKGHRGFIDGDFVMVMYGFSPNWLATSHGNEPYNLYIRRSFDGGVSWTTTPALPVDIDRNGVLDSLGGDGATYDQTFGVGDRAWTITRDLAAGEFEPARNVSQLTSSKDTILDPRYSPTNLGTQGDVTRVLESDASSLVPYHASFTSALPYPDDDVRDPSKFFAVYETGDATVVLTAGEADPWDLYASRATNWGDDWETEDVFAKGREEWEERWDWLENKDETMSGEASVVGSPGGDFMWVVWNQWIEDEEGNVSEADPVFRRLWWDANTDPVADAGGPYDTTTLTASAELTLIPESGALLVLAGSGADPDGDEIVSYEWDLDNDGDFDVSGSQVSFPATGAPQAVALRVCDSKGSCDVDQAWVNRPDAHIPRVWRIDPQPAVALVDETVDITGKINVPGTPDAAAVLWDWGDGSDLEPGALPPEEQGKGSGVVAGSHAYDAAGVYTVTLIVFDDDGRLGFDTNHVVVEDPCDRRYVSGGGWLKSPTGALSGTTTGGYLGLWLYANRIPWSGAPYGWASVILPDGQILQTTSIDWIAIEPDGTTHVGATGLLSWETGYELLLTVKDGVAKTKKAPMQPDRVRVRVWRTGAGKSSHVVYDSQSGDAFGAAPTAPLYLGNLRLFTGGWRTRLFCW